MRWRARRGRCRARRVRRVGTAHRTADARRPAVRPQGLQHRNARVDGAVPVPLRLLPGGAAVPAVDPRVQPLHSAVCLLPMAAVVMPMSRVAPHLVDRLGQRAVMTVGLVVPRRRARRHVPAGRALDLLALPRRALRLRSRHGVHVDAVDHGHRQLTSAGEARVASAVNDVSRELGSALGIAILGSLYNSGYRGRSGTPPRGCRPKRPMPSANRLARVSRWHRTSAPMDDSWRTPSTSLRRWADGHDDRWGHDCDPYRGVHALACPMTKCCSGSRVPDGVHRRQRRGGTRPRQATRAGRMKEPPM